jgi:hypothetical protein
MLRALGVKSSAQANDPIIDEGNVLAATNAVAGWPAFARRGN